MIMNTHFPSDAAHIASKIIFLNERAKTPNRHGAELAITEACAVMTKNDAIFQADPEGSELVRQVLMVVTKGGSLPTGNSRWNVQLIEPANLS